MTRADFPTITPDIARRYIATARLTPNAVKFRIRQILSPRMKVVCAWCNKSIREIACEAAMHGETTHGICDECSEKYFGFTLQRDTPTSECGDDSNGCGNDSSACRHAVSLLGSGEGSGIYAGDRAARVEPPARSTGRDLPVVSSATPAKEMARIRAEAGDRDSAYAANVGNAVDEKSLSGGSRAMPEGSSAIMNEEPCAAGYSRAPISSGSHFGAASAKQSCGPNVSNESKECREAITRQVTPAATDQISVTAPGSINCPPLDSFSADDCGVRASRTGCAKDSHEGRVIGLRSQQNHNLPART